VWGLTALVQLSDRTPADPSKWVDASGTDGVTTWLRMASLPGSDIEWLVFLAAGPLAQLAGIGLGLRVARRADHPVVASVGLLVAIVNGFGHALHQFVAAIQGGVGDEALLAEYAGVAWWVFAGIFGLTAAVGCVAAIRMLPGKATRIRWGAAALVGATIPGPLLMRIQALVVDGVDRGAPMFAPVVGFSFPVVILGAAGMLGLRLLVRRWPLAGATT
jgi:hypothetical protein